MPTPLCICPQNEPNTLFRPPEKKDWAIDHGDFEFDLQKNVGPYEKYQGHRCPTQRKPRTENKLPHLPPPLCRVGDKLCQHSLGICPKNGPNTRFRPPKKVQDLVIDHGDFEFDLQKNVGPRYLEMAGVPPEVNYGPNPRVGGRYPKMTTIFGFPI